MNTTSRRSSHDTPHLRERASLRVIRTPDRDAIAHHLAGLEHHLMALGLPAEAAVARSIAADLAGLR